MLIKRYYAGEPVRSLLVEFDICCSPGSLWRHFPAIQTGETCPACGAPLVERYRGRTPSTKHAKVTRCMSCLHRESIECTCLYCQRRRDEARVITERHRRTAIVNFCQTQWDYSSHTVVPTELSACVAFAFLCMTRSGGWVAPSKLGSLNDALPRFAPFGQGFCNDLLLKVIANQLAVPSPDSPLEAFADDIADQPSWSEERVHWQLLMLNPSAFVYELELLISEKMWPIGWAEEVRTLWLELAIAECTEFWILNALQQDLPLPCQTALSALLRNLLVDYSVSQVFELLSTAITDTADFIARKYISGQQAENFVVGACQRLADRARTNGATIKGLPRDPILGRTQASHVLHDLFLGIGEDAFFRVIPRG